MHRGRWTVNLLDIWYTWKWHR